LASQARAQYNEYLYREIVALADVERATAGGFTAGLMPAPPSADKKDSKKKSDQKKDTPPKQDGRQKDNGPPKNESSQNAVFRPIIPPALTRPLPDSVQWRSSKRP
jgi:hypothetical protein